MNKRMDGESGWMNEWMDRDGKLDECMEWLNK